MHLQVAANVGELTRAEAMRAVFGGFDFAGHLAEFRLDVSEARAWRRFPLRFCRRRPCRLSAVVRAYSLSVQPMSRARPRRRDVVRFRAGEIKQRGAEVFFREQADIHLQAVAEQDADFVFSVREGLIDCPDISGCVRRRRRCLSVCRGRAAW